MRNPKISVVMPVYNSERYIKASIESILTQTFKNFEFIIIDDGSNDDSFKIIDSYQQKDKRIIVVHNTKNIGTTKTLNIGLSIAKEKYIVRMDADDWSYPDRLQKQFNYMEKHLDVGVSGGTIEVCDKNLNTLNVRKYPLTDKAIRKIIFRYSPFAHPATIWDTKTLKSIGGYNENIPLSQDYELYFRIGRIKKFGNLATTLIKLRTHSDSSSIVRGRYQEQYAIYCRIKAFLELGYNMTFFDKLYTFVQMMSMVIIPTRLKFWIFNYLRRFI